jgi:peptide/nickel transport system permease protein
LKVPEWLLIFLKVLKRNKLAFTSFIILLAYIVVALIAVTDLLPPLPPENTNMIYSPPSLKLYHGFPWYILGTDFTGRPLLLELFYGTPSILLVAFIAALITVGVGLIVGLIAGYLGGIVDTIISAILDVVLVIPGIVLIIILAAIIHTTNPFIIAGILSITSWAGLARAIRSQVLSLKERDFIAVAKVTGFSRWKIMYSELTPLMAPYIFINLLLGMVGAIYALVGLYFIGILPLSIYNWGVQLNNAISIGGAIYTSKGEYALWAPIIAIVLFQISLINLTSVTDQLFNPALRGELNE